MVDTIAAVTVLRNRTPDAVAIRVETKPCDHCRKAGGLLTYHRDGEVSAATNGRVLCHSWCMYCKHETLDWREVGE